MLAIAQGPERSGGAGFAGLPLRRWLPHRRIFIGGVRPTRTWERSSRRCGPGSASEAIEG